MVVVVSLEVVGGVVVTALVEVLGGIVVTALVELVDRVVNVVVDPLVVLVELLLVGGSVGWLVADGSAVASVAWSAPVVELVVPVVVVVGDPDGDAHDTTISETTASPLSHLTETALLSSKSSDFGEHWSRPKTPLIVFSYAGYPGTTEPLTGLVQRSQNLLAANLRAWPVAPH